MSGGYLYCQNLDCGQYLGSLVDDRCGLCGWHTEETTEDLAGITAENDSLNTKLAKRGATKMSDKTPEEVIALAKHFGVFEVISSPYRVPHIREQAVLNFAAALTAAFPAEQGKIVVTKNEAGVIVGVTRQDEEGRILSIISESAQPAPAADAEAVMKWLDVNCRRVSWNIDGASFEITDDQAFALANLFTIAQPAKSALKSLLNKLDSRIGVHPLSVNGVPRTERQNGWNDCSTQVSAICDEVNETIAQPEQPAKQQSQDSHLSKALLAAQRTIGSMKQTAETAGAGGDKRMIQEACESISKEGLVAFTAINAAIAARGVAK